MRFKYWPRHEETGNPPQLSLIIGGSSWGIRFGRPERPMFSERYSGQHSIPKSYWYGPFGLTFIHKRDGRRAR